MAESDRTMREGQVVAALEKANGQWVKRSELAKLLGRDRLYPLDLEALAYLEGTGKVEVERRPDPRPAGYTALYRLRV